LAAISIAERHAVKPSTQLANQGWRRRETRIGVPGPVHEERLCIALQIL